MYDFLWKISRKFIQAKKSLSANFYTYTEKQISKLSRSIINRNVFNPNFTSNSAWHEKKLTENVTNDNNCIMQDSCNFSIKWIPVSLREKFPYSEFFWSVFSAFGLEGVSRRIQSENGKKRTRNTPNTDDFYAVIFRYLTRCLWTKR